MRIIQKFPRLENYRCCQILYLFILSFYVYNFGVLLTIKWNLVSNFQLSKWLFWNLPERFNVHASGHILDIKIDSTIKISKQTIRCVRLLQLQPLNLYGFKVSNLFWEHPIWIDAWNWYYLKILNVLSDYWQVVNYKLMSINT